VRPREMSRILLCPLIIIGTHVATTLIVVVKKKERKRK
jgi:hypothetical protein